MVELQNLFSIEIMILVTKNYNFNNIYKYIDELVVLNVSRDKNFILKFLIIIAIQIRCF